MLNKKQIDKILEPTIEGLGFEFICSEVANIDTGNSKKRNSSILRIYIDKLDQFIDGKDSNSDKSDRKGVTLEDCQTVSKHINRLLEVEMNEELKYNLEISSPGLDRPLVKLKHFARFIGKKVKVKLNQAIEHEDTGINQRNIVGYIKEVSKDSQVVVTSIDSDDILFKIDIDNINKANIVPEWK